MHKVSARSLRRYRGNLKHRRPFYIELRTPSGPAKIFVDSGGWATAQDKDGKYSLSLGPGVNIVNRLETGAKLPEPQVQQYYGQEPRKPEFGAIEGYEVVEDKPREHEVKTEATEQPKVAKEPGQPKSIPNAEKLVAAWAKGSTHFHAPDDTLEPIAEGSSTLRWLFTPWAKVEGKWKALGREVVATFSASVVTFPGPTDRRGVAARRALLRQHLLDQGAGISLKVES